MYNLPKLVDEVNKQLSDLGLENQVNERLVRHYTTEKLVPAPLKEGKEARYTEEHVNALVSLRNSQSIGYSTKVLKSTLLSASGSTSSNSLLASNSYCASPDTSYEQAVLAKSNASNPALDFLSTLSESNKPPMSRGFSASAKSSSSLTAPVASMVAQSAHEPEQKWSRIVIKDGLEVNIREDIKSNITASDLALLSQKLTNLK